VRLETSRNRDRGGTGLGLAIANNVVRRHGGKLRFVGNAGDFRVEVVLPRAAATRSA
jgi:protein-histidine pros-kinase